MKITSNSHQDSHAALRVLIDTALDAWTAHLCSLKEDLELVNAEIESFNALPWYKRWFDGFFAPSNETCLYYVGVAEWNIRFLQRLKRRTEYELTIHLDDSESNIVFYGSVPV
jgi:hypothetical protein